MANRFSNENVLGSLDAQKKVYGTKPFNNQSNVVANRRALHDISNTKQQTTVDQGKMAKRASVPVPTTTKAPTTQAKHLSITNNSISNAMVLSSPVKEESVDVEETQQEFSSPVRKNKVDAMIMSPKVDAQDTQNPQACTEYVKDIFAHYRSIEAKYLPDPNYMDFQSNFTAQSRILTLNWILNIHFHYKMSSETLFLTANIFDRFFACYENIALDKVHLVAVTSLFIASKYEEIKCMTTDHLIKVTRGMYTKEEILHMERAILKALDFNLTIASVHVFLKRYMKCSGSFDDLQVQIASFASEMSIFDIAMLQYTPSTIACACIYVARSIRKFGGDKWNSNLIYYTGKTEEDILPCAKQLYFCMRNFVNTLAFDGGKKPEKNYLLYKYSHAERLCISEKLKNCLNYAKKKE